MLLLPKQYKFKSMFIRKKININNTSNSNFNLGSQSLFSLESGRISSKEIESVRKYLRLNLRKESKIWITIFPSNIITKKPQETRMGKCKGYLKYWAHFLKTNDILFQTKGLTSKYLSIKKALNGACYKLSVISNVFAKI